ncbi:MAG: hypothetical protein IJ689_05470 [Alphaproteobacteria bacterium]|nr:hypothetical protein [Alphaproteobacteria bacterium]
MKKYILMLGLASVALGSYCAYAGNSATMTVTATIAHDVSLSVTQDIDLGTITINPAAAYLTEWGYSDSGVYRLYTGDAVVSADNAIIGSFTANIPNPEACNTASDSCGGLSFIGDQPAYTVDIFGGGGWGNDCYFLIKYSGSENSFKVFPYACGIDEGGVSSVTPGLHEGMLTISYTPD